MHACLFFLFKFVFVGLSKCRTPLELLLVTLEGLTVSPFLFITLKSAHGCCCTQHSDQVVRDLYMLLQQSIHGFQFRSVVFFQLSWSSLFFRLGFYLLCSHTLGSVTLSLVVFVFFLKSIHGVTVRLPLRYLTLRSARH